MLVEGASFSQQSDLHLCKIILLPDNQVIPTPKVKRSQRWELFSHPKVTQMTQKSQKCKYLKIGKITKNAKIPKMHENLAFYAISPILWY